MNCPLDGATLAVSDRQGIEIDYCSFCPGVWLDRGELEKIVEHSSDYDRRDDEERNRCSCEARLTPSLEGTAEARLPW